MTQVAVPAQAHDALVEPGGVPARRPFESIGVPGRLRRADELRR